MMKTKQNEKKTGATKEQWTIGGRRSQWTNKHLKINVWNIKEKEKKKISIFFRLFFFPPIFFFYYTTAIKGVQKTNWSIDLFSAICKNKTKQKHQRIKNETIVVVIGGCGNGGAGCCCFYRHQSCHAIVIISMKYETKQGKKFHFFLYTISKFFKIIEILIWRQGRGRGNGVKKKTDWGAGRGVVRVSWLIKWMYGWMVGWMNG